MAAPDPTREPRALLVSIGITLVLAVLGVHGADPDLTVRREEEIRVDLESRLRHLPSAFTLWINLELHPKQV